MREHVLLLGNGLNDANNKGYKWIDLIKDVVEHLKLKNLSVVKEKPFTLLYEEIFLTNLKETRVSEYKLKSFIAEKLKDILPSALHTKIMSLNFSDIMTTNYDYTIENSNTGVSKDLHDKGIIKQNRYSLFRHNEVNGCKVWHIHGEINKPGTILLGYEHYSGQLQQIRNYVVSGTGNSYKNYQFPPLIKLLKNGKVENNSWLDIFFTKDIHIVGLTLDFVELDLWWLLTYRARRILEKKSPINNEITYYYPKALEDTIQYKLEMFRANEVLTKAFGNKHDLAYYNDVFDYIKKVAS